MANDFKINKAAISKITKSIEREFAKNPVKVPLVMDTPDASEVAMGATVTGGTTYNGPVVQIVGDSAQVAINNNDVSQANSSTKKDVTPGFEPIATAVGHILEGIAGSGLSTEDMAEVEAEGKVVLEEVVKPEPDKGLLKRSLTMLKGLLTPIAIGAQDGATDAVQESAHNWAVTGIKALVAAAALL